MSGKAKHSTSSSSKFKEYPYPSSCGSHASMIDEEATAKLTDNKFVVCKDFEGLYVTERSRLDNGLADSYRNASPEWKQDMLVKKTATDCSVAVS